MAEPATTAKTCADKIYAWSEIPYSKRDSKDEAHAKALQCQAALGADYKVEPHDNHYDGYDFGHYKVVDNTDNLWNTVSRYVDSFIAWNARYSQYAKPITQTVRR